MKFHYCYFVQGAEQREIGEKMGYPNLLSLCLDKRLYVKEISKVVILNISINCRKKVRFRYLVYVVLVVLISGVYNVYFVMKSRAGGWAFPFFLFHSTPLSYNMFNLIECDLRLNVENMTV